MPKVSVVIPNYNHASYLAQRIESVLNQTLRDTEVLILDDCSPDNSREIIERYAQRDPRIRVLYNEQNSGNTFKQWNKGIAQATGEYVWLAESDDYSDERFLEVLVAKLDSDPGIGIAYCDSWLVDGSGVVARDVKSYLHWADAQQWQQDFVLDGQVLIRRYLSFICPIPNASSAVTRRSVLAAVGPANTSLRLVGDWLYWSRIFAVTKVAYSAERLNYFRQHTNNVRSAVRGGKELLEFSAVIRHMRRYGPPDQQIYERAMSINIERWFYVAVYSDFALASHRQLLRNFAHDNRAFPRIFVKNLVKLLFQNKLSGIKHLIGGKLLKRPSFAPPYWVTV